jgi:hypothetical protein
VLRHGRESAGGGLTKGPRDDSRGGRILRPGGGGKGKRLMPFFELANSGEHVLLIPPGTLYGATLGKPEQRKPLRNAAFASLCNPLQRLSDHS